MPGGLGGPPPKRDAERRRRNKPTIPTETVNIDELISAPVEVPVPDEGWHPIARQLFDSIKRSGTAIFMEPSDWAAAYLLCESISRDLEPQVVGITEEGEVVRAEIPLKGASMTAYLRAFASLMLMEGDRRRLRIELERKKATDAAAAAQSNVVSLAKARSELFS